MKSETVLSTVWGIPDTCFDFPTNKNHQRKLLNIIPLKDMQRIIEGEFHAAGMATQKPIQRLKQLKQKSIQLARQSEASESAWACRHGAQNKKTIDNRSRIPDISRGWILRLRVFQFILYI